MKGIDYLIAYGMKLERSFYLRDTVTVAKGLLGKYIVHIVNGRELVAEITETEAYTGVDDKACHSYGKKRTDRTKVMYLPGGCTYVYMIYGMHFMLNVVTEGENIPCAVLIRKGNPVDGLNEISRNRYGKDYAKLSTAKIKELMDGPAKLCQSLAITKDHNCESLLGNKLFIAEPLKLRTFDTGSGKRINIPYAEEAIDWPYRFFIEKDTF